MKTETNISGDWVKQAGRNHAALRCVASPDRAVVDTLFIVDRPLVIGREAGDGRIVVNDGRMSRMHAVVFPENGELRVRDTGSRNGTFVDGVPGGEVLKGGAVLRVGSTLFVATTRGSSAFDERPEDSLIGRSPLFRETCAKLAKAAKTPMPVMLNGESGSGKEGLARLVHLESGRKGDFVTANCATLLGEVGTATLFGHTRGAFTGATQARPGLFRAADGGTLFLDELADLPLEVQPRLLRVLEQHEVVPVGDVKPIQVDVRIVTATHINLLQAVEAGRFRGDLYARLSGYALEVPPLRERPEDIARLVRHFSGQDEPFEVLALESLIRYSWPFNIRELRQLVAKLLIESPCPIPFEALPPQVQFRPAAGPEPVPSTAKISTRASPPEDNPTDLRRTVPDRTDPRRTVPDRQVTRPTQLRPRPEREELVALLVHHAWNVSEVARVMSRDRKQIYRWIEQYEIEVPEGAGDRPRKG